MGVYYKLAIIIITVVYTRVIGLIVILTILITTITSTVILPIIIIFIYFTIHTASMSMFYDHIQSDIVQILVLFFIHLRLQSSLEKPVQNLELICLILQHSLVIQVINLLFPVIFQPLSVYQNHYIRSQMLLLLYLTVSGILVYQLKIRLLYSRFL